MGILLPLKTLVRFPHPLESAACALLRVPLLKSVREPLWNHGIWHSLQEHWGSVYPLPDPRHNQLLSTFRINTYECLLSVDSK
jgi:hypothetical protein